MAHISQLAYTANSIQVTDMMALLFENDNERDFKLVKETYVMCQELTIHCQERHEQIMELQRLIVSTVAVESLRLLRELQDDELEKSKGMMKLIRTLSWLEKHMYGQEVATFIKVKRRHEQIIEMQSAPSSSLSTLPLSVLVVRLGHGLSLDVDDPVDVSMIIAKGMFDDSAEKYSIFEVNYDECEILSLFYCIPRNSLEIGLTIVEGDSDMKFFLDMAELYGLINLYIANLPRNLAAYYYKNSTFNASDEDMKYKLKSHEKLKLDASSMCFDEIVS
ncbi:hypothetical protein Tco_0779397 [Tanacetum coccineum]